MARLLLPSLIFFIWLAEGLRGEKLDFVKQIEAIEYRFRRDQAQLEDQYRKGLAELIAKANWAEIFLVEFDLVEATQDAKPVRVRKRVDGYDGSSGGFGDPKESSSEYFWIAPYRVESFVVIKKPLKAGSNELKALRQHVAEMVGKIDGDESGGLGHMPTYAIRLCGEDGATVLFETSISPLFGNAWVRYPGHAVYWKWHKVPGRDLLEFLESALPATPEYAARYRESVGRLTGRDPGNVQGR